nr:PREDICTED: dystroglycan [Tribolium castaneum]XP_008195449.1 PREDICTED: dystroglycan [Tribolium castaneum]XP_974516.2 PREDICTED: dystroglycan [Tribolium castaneum]|eukprot:XP_008195448.1 PREDICTED: dystroglycan [Tribolium castaneum]
MRDPSVRMSSFVVAALLAVAIATQALEEDFAFDVSDDFEVEVNAGNREIEAAVGKVFHYVVPQVAATGGFEARRSDGSPLPSWLLFDKIGAVFWGVPLGDDVGSLHLVIRNRNISEDVTINVRETSDLKDRCPSTEDNTVLILLIDKGVRAIKPKQRVIAVNNVAKFFGLPYSAFTLKPQLEKDDITDSSVVLAGPGNFKPKSAKSTSVKVAVGCDGRLWVQTAPLVHQLKQQARDGTISEVLGLPLIGWRVKTEPKSSRTKRQTEDYGSGDYDDDYYDNYEDEYEYEEEDTKSSTTTTVSPTPTHPHRHHHGESLPEETHHQNQETSSQVVPTTVEMVPETTTTTTTPKPTTEETPLVTNATKIDNSYEYEDYDYDLEENEEDPIESKIVVPEFVPKPSETTEATTTTTAKSTTIQVVETVPTVPTTTERETTMMIIEDTEPATVLYETTNLIPETSPVATTDFSTTTATITTTTEEEELPTTPSTTTRHVVTSPRTTEMTESVELEEKNFPPYIENRLKQMSVIAGKIFRFVVPKNTFNDFEDGHNLTLEFLNSRGEPLSKDSWCHFNPHRREIYGLPLEEDVSKWEYVLKATDREGASITDVFTIQVQQHKLQRVVNHEISLFMRIEKQQEFPHFVDWCLKTLRALGKIYNTNMTEITVRNVNYTSEPVVFTWTNDSIPTNYCPVEEIDKLYKMLTANDRGDPKQELSLLLTPDLRVKKVTKHGLGVCETPQVPVTPPTNFSPFLRNPVDHINATVGELLIFKVPDDTFYDPEDTDSRTLNISLLTGDRQAIKSTNWLQFDSKNREFYGIPRKPGRSEYHLVCVDSGGATATDSLEIVVYPAHKMHYNVEFSMTVETPYDTFVNSASMQRKFVEKLQEIFGDRNSSSLYFNPFKQKDHSTVITWFNRTLSTSKCPHDEINHLESVLKNHQDRGISHQVSRIMEPEFLVSKISVFTMGNCRTKSLPPPVHEDVIPVDEKSPDASAAQYQYLMTFIIPAVIISIMLFFAALCACVLYRRRRTGKLNVEEDGRQSYGNKGIPVIFQEELEEKPESGTKTPVILKDEKPPLAPPEYSKSGSLKLTDDSEPYQPPPPFTRTDGRQPRPKPTPTYRKPPPYVPP